MLTNTSQLILRNQHLFERQSVLLLNHEQDLLANEIASIATDTVALALDYNHHLHLKASAKGKLDCYFGHQLPVQKTFATVIVYFPKAKSLAPYLFHLAAMHLEQGGQLIVIGDNKGGVKSIAKLLPNYFTSPMKRDNARHSLLYSAELVSAAPAIKLQDWCSSYQLVTANYQLTICNLVGVFSEKHLDLGTQLLLEHLPALTGRVLDFGCGAGVIAASLLKLQPKLQLECVDINAMALASCELTLAANNMTAKVFASDGLAQTQGHYNAIISNPPFHDGLNSTTDIALNFVADSHKQLVKGGYWQIVSNRHLPYGDKIADTFGSVTVIAENNKYKVYQQQK